MESTVLERLENKNEFRILVTLSLPIIMSMLVQGLYSLVDGVFISYLGDEALSAISLSFVYVNLFNAVFTGLATGINAVISREIGAKRIRDAKTAVLSGIAIQTVVSIVAVISSIMLIDFYFQKSTTNEAVRTFGSDYLTIIMCFSFLSCAQQTLERILQSSGLSKLMIFSQVTGTVVNSILDPILIFGLGPIPAFGIKGAAWATVIGQLSAAAVALILNLKKNRVLFDGLFKEAKISLSQIREIFWIGLPAASVGIASSIGNYYINIILIRYISTANAAFGVYTKLQSVALIPTQGFGAGLLTQFSYFYGQRNWKRIRKSLIAGLVLCEVWALFCFTCFFFFPTVLMKPFNLSEQMIEIGIPCFRIIGLTYLVSCFMLVLNSFFQANGQGVFTFIISVSRQLLVRIPVASFLTRFGNIELIWWCWPISEVISDTITVIFFIIGYRKLRNKLTGGNND